MEQGRKNTVYDERQRIWPICYYLAYLDRVHSGYKLVFPLPVHHTSFHRAVELVNYIHVFLIVFLVCNSLYKCSTHSIVPNYRQLKRRNIFFCYCKQGITFVIMRAPWCLNIKVVINYLNDTTKQTNCKLHLTWTSYHFVANLSFLPLSVTFLSSMLWSWWITFTCSWLFSLFACFSARAPSAPRTPVSIN